MEDKKILLNANKMFIFLPVSVIEVFYQVNIGVTATGLLNVKAIKMILYAVNICTVYQNGLKEFLME